MGLVGGYGGAQGLPCDAQHPSGFAILEEACTDRSFFEECYDEVTTGLLRASLQGKDKVQ